MELWDNSLWDIDFENVIITVKLYKHLLPKNRPKKLNNLHIIMFN